MEFLAAWIADHVIGNSDDVLPRTPLGWTRVALLAGLIAQIAYLIHIWVVSSAPIVLWFGILANSVALLVVRRMLKWRYPI